MNKRGPASPLLCLAVAASALACALGQVVFAAAEPKPDHNRTGADAIGPGAGRLSVPETDHVVVVRDPQPSI